MFPRIPLERSSTSPEYPKEQRTPGIFHESVRRCPGALVFFPSPYQRMKLFDNPGLIQWDRLLWEKNLQLPICDRGVLVRA